MQRPLTKKVEDSLEWTMAVKERPHRDGFSYPVFEWSFGSESEFSGGELRAWPLQGTLIFQDRRESEPWRFQSVEEALAKVDEYGWGEPPNVDEVFQDALSTHNRLQEEGVQGSEEAEKIFKELKEKWEALATQ